MHITVSEQERRYLSSVDPDMKRACRTIGPIDREIGRTLFEGIALQIVAQQISNAAFASIRARLGDELLSADNALALGKAPLRFAGLSEAKANCLLDVADRFNQGYFRDLPLLDDEAARQKLVAIKGIGSWTADMVLIFALGRKDVFTIKDAGIRIGLRKLYGFKTISEARAGKLRKKYSPCATAACLLLWEAAKWE